MENSDYMLTARVNKLMDGQKGALSHPVHLQTKSLSKIKLKKVNSSKDVKYELASPEKISSITRSSPKQIFFQKLLYNDFRVSSGSEFKLLTQSIKSAPNTHEIMSFHQLKNIVQGLKADKVSKVLLLVDDKILKDYREFIEKNKLGDKIEIMVYGELKPNKELLRDNVYFASDDGELILKELEKLKFEEVDWCRSEYMRLSTIQKNRFKLNQMNVKSATLVQDQSKQENKKSIVTDHKKVKHENNKPQLQRLSERSRSVASLYSANSSQIEHYIRSWIVDLDPKEKNKRIASYVTMKQDSRRKVDGSQLEMMNRKGNKIVGLKRSQSELSASSFAKRLDNAKKEEEDRISSQIDLRMPTDLEGMEETTPIERLSSSQKLQRQQSLPDTHKKSSTIIKKSTMNNQPRLQKKHQIHPQKVIQQMSDEYRGSNRESVVNVDDYFANQAKENGGGSLLRNGNFNKMKEKQQRRSDYMIKSSKGFGGGSCEGIVIDVKQEKQSNSKINELPSQISIQSEGNKKQRLIDGLTGELIGTYDDMLKRSNSNMDNIRKRVTKIEQQQIYQPHSSIQTNKSTIRKNFIVVKPLTNIKPEIAKITQMSALSIVGNENDHNIVGEVNNNVCSATSIRDQSRRFQHARDLGYDKVYETGESSKVINPSALGYQAVRNKQTSPSTTTIHNTNNTSNNYLLTGSKTAISNRNVQKSPITATINEYTVVTSPPKYKIYTPEEYRAKYGIEAANNVLSPKSKDYYSTSTVVHSQKPKKQSIIIPMQKPTTVNEDPFMEQKSSKLSSSQRGSYIMRKQVGKRDPFSPYQQNGSSKIVPKQSLLNKQRSSIIMNHENNGKLKQNRQLLSPRMNGVHKLNTDMPLSNQRVTVRSTQSKTILEEIGGLDSYRLSSSSKMYGMNGGMRYELSERNYANSPVGQEGNPFPLRQESIRPLVYDSRSPMKVSQFKPIQLLQAEEGQIQLKEVSTNTKAQNNKQKQIRSSNEQEIGVISLIHKQHQQQQIPTANIHKHNQTISQNPFQDIKTQIQQSRINRASQIKSTQDYTLLKKYLSDQQVLMEIENYAYIDTSVNEFYILVDEDLSQIHMWVTKHLKTSNDTMETYRGLEGMYEKLRVQRERRLYDMALVFTRKADIDKVNKKLLCENTYLVELLDEQYQGMEILEREHRIKIGKLEYLKLAQKVVVETMVTHVILYQQVEVKVRNEVQNTNESSFSKQVSHILSLFPEGHFIKHPYIPPLTSKNIAQLLIDDPKFTRLYIICNQKQILHLQGQVRQLTSQQPTITQGIIKLICVQKQKERLPKQYETKRIEDYYPNVKWGKDMEKIDDYRLEKVNSNNTKVDVSEREKVFYHIRHKHLVNIIQKEFPARFEYDNYASMNQVERKIMKAKNQMRSKSNASSKVKQSVSPMSKRVNIQSKPKNTPNPKQTIVNYLILHPLTCDEFVDVKLFKKVLLFGKSQRAQRKVVKTSTIEELIQLLKK